MSRLDECLRDLEYSLAAGKITKWQADNEYDRLMKEYRYETEQEAEDAYDQVYRDRGIRNER